MIDFSIDGLSLIERGENWPQSATVEKLANAFGIPATDLFDGLEVEGTTKLPNQMARARATLARLPESQLILAAELLETLERNSTE
jgi:transcriptional regulator with XRE-family HTH domain